MSDETQNEMPTWKRLDLLPGMDFGLECYIPVAKKGWEIVSVFRGNSLLHPFVAFKRLGVTPERSHTSNSPQEDA